MQSHRKAPKGSIVAPEAMEQTAWTLDETGVAQAKNWLRERGGANTTASPADKDELADKLGVLPVKRRRAAPRISSRIMWLTHSPSVPGGRPRRKNCTVAAPLTVLLCSTAHGAALGCTSGGNARCSASGGAPWPMKKGSIGNGR